MEASPTVVATASYGTTTEKAVADRFLQQIGGAQTPDMERAVIAWMRFESGKGSVTANNPWNLTGSLWNAIVGYWRGGSATEQHDFPIFATLNDGVDAAAQNLQSGSFGYPSVVSKARAGDAPGFLQALAASQWCTCHYPSWATRSGAQAAIAAVNPGTVTSHAPGQPATPGPVDATLTTAGSANPSDILAWLASYFADHSSDVGHRTWGDFFSTPNPAFIGSPLGSKYTDAINTLGWQNKVISIADFPKLAAAIASAKEYNAGNPLDWGAAIVHFLGAIANPTNWARALAIGAGTGLILWGGKIVWEASS